MKIIFVIQTLRLGGAERVVSFLSQEFQKSGFEVFIILFDKKISYEYGGEIIALDLKASKDIFKKGINFVKRVKRLKEIFKDKKPNYIFSFVESCNFVSILSGFEVVVSIRNNPLKKHSFWQRFLIKRLYRFKNVKKIVTVSNEIEKILNHQFGLTNTKTIQNPVVFKEQSLKKEDKNYILAVGRLHKQKNFQMLIKAYSQTKVKDVAKLLIVGEGEQKKELQNLIDELNLNDRVILVGAQKDVDIYYSLATIFVLSSLYEGFPNVLIEALSFNLPVISTNCLSGPSEIITHEKNGLLVKNNDQKELSLALDRLYFDKDLQKRFRENAKKSIQHLEIKEIARRWLDIY